MTTIPAALDGQHNAPLPPADPAPKAAPDAAEALLTSFAAQDARLHDLALLIRESGDLLRRAPARLTRSV